MLNLTWLEILFGGIAAVLAVLIGFRAEMTRAQGGKILAFLALFILPAVALWGGLSQHMERSKSTQFCMSCHVMEDYGKSLRIDDKSYLPAAHFQNNRIPREQACYTCHSDYTMFGGVSAKLRGLRHVWVQYFGTIPQPKDIKLYQPFNNRECLHCHAGSRSYLEASPHHKKPDTLARTATNELSCMSSNCHDIVHDVDTLGDVKLWDPNGN